MLERKNVRKWGVSEMTIYFGLIEDKTLWQLKEIFFRKFI